MADHKVSTHDNPADLIKFGRALNLRGSFFTDLGQPAVLNPPNASVNVASILAGTDSANSASTEEATEDDVVQARRVLAMISLPFADGIALSDTKLAAANARKSLQTTASLKPSWRTLRTR